MSMFPPELSKQILDNRIKHKNLFYIPGKSDAIWSYLYYICYFKNKDSLIPIHKVSDIQEYRRKLLGTGDDAKKDLVKHKST